MPNQEGSHHGGIVIFESSGGWERLEIVNRRSVTYGEGHLVVGISIRVRFWIRDSMAPSELVPDHDINLDQIVLSIGSVIRLDKALGIWLGSYEPIHVVLSDSADQQVSISIGVREDLITSPRRPALTFRYTTAKLRLEQTFVVDETCVRAAREGLKYLREEAGSTNQEV